MNDYDIDLNRPRSLGGLRLTD